VAKIGRRPTMLAEKQLLEQQSASRAHKLNLSLQPRFTFLKRKGNIKKNQQNQKTL